MKRLVYNCNLEPTRVISLDIVHIENGQPAPYSGPKETVYLCKRPDSALRKLVLIRNNVTAAVYHQIDLDRRVQVGIQSEERGA